MVLVKNLQFSHCFIKGKIKERKCLLGFFYGEEKWFFTL